MPHRILVVDDHPAVLLVMRAMLEAQGYEVASASDGVETLAYLQANTVDLVLLDIMMPRKDGIQTLRELRAATATANLPVILVTAKAEDEDILNGYRVRADYYLTKPFTGEQLRYGVRLFLGDGTEP